MRKEWLQLVEDTLGANARHLFPGGPSCGQVETRLLDAPWSEVPVARQALAEALGKFIAQAGEEL